MRIVIFEIFLILFSVCNVFAEDLLLDNPTPPPILKCKIPVKVLSLDSKNCKTNQENELCSISITVRPLEKKCGYVKGQSFKINSALVTTNLANKLKFGYKKTLKIEEVERCLINIYKGSLHSQNCQKGLQYTIE